MRKNKGITLIALVITIIVLLILAGVALRMVAGNEGILTKAEKAVSETNIAGAKEQTEIMLAELSAEYYEKKFVDKTESGNLVDYIKNALATAKPTSNGEFSVSIDGSGKVSVTDKGGNTVVSGTLDENGKIIWDENAGGNGGAVVEPPLEVPENPVASYDVSMARDGSIMVYVVEREDEAGKYDLLVIGEGAMKDISSYNCTPYASDYGEDIKTIRISQGITEISNFAFASCTSFETINIPSSVIYIDFGAFSGCTSLSSINIPESVTSIGEYAFDECTSLSSINIPDSVTSIGGSAFEDCTRLSSINIPESVTSIGDGAFSSCTSLSSINIPDSVTSIGNGAFHGCTSLSSINIPNSVTSIGDGAFYDTAWYNAQPEGVVYAGKVLYEYKGTMPSNTSITVNEGTKGIADYAFSDCTSLSSINIPESVTSIGSCAFEFCTSLSSINIREGVTSIGDSAFYGCTSLSSINIPNSVTSIGDSAFYDTAWYNAQPEGVVYAGKVLYKYKGTMPSNTSITVNEGTKGIADSAFSGCTNLSSINIPNSVTSIGGSAFYRCTSLSSINIPESVTSIGDWAFYYWTEEQTINCEILEANKPSGWEANWDYYDYSRARKAKINWGVSM